MDFSEVFEHRNARLCCWSPDGQYLAVVSKCRIIVRLADTLAVAKLFTCSAEVQQLEWSGDSQFILCGLLKKNVVQVWSMVHSDWSCKITEGAGLASARWSFDSGHIFVISDFQLRLSIWSLLDETASLIKNVKSIDSFEFNHSGTLLALLERKNCKDFVSLFVTRSWDLSKHFQIETREAGGFFWSLDDTSLIVWDSCLEYRIFRYALDGKLLGRYSAYENNALGIKAVCRSRAGIIAVGSYDQKVRFLDERGLEVIGERAHSAIVQPKDAAIYREVKILGNSKYVLSESPVTMPAIKPNPSKPNPALGVGLMQWSSDSKLLVTRNDNMPCVLWIWDVIRLSVTAVIVLEEPVRCVAWDPHNPRLAFCDGSANLSLWTPHGCSQVLLPEGDMLVQSLSWNPEGKVLLLVDNDRFSCCYVNVDMKFQEIK